MSREQCEALDGHRRNGSDLPEGIYKEAATVHQESWTMEYLLTEPGRVPGSSLCGLTEFEMRAGSAIVNVRGPEGHEMEA